MWIDRDLLAEDRDGEIGVMDRNRIDILYDPMVILGDPGMGKTTLMRHMRERAGHDVCSCGRAGAGRRSGIAAPGRRPHPRRRSRRDRVPRPGRRNRRSDEAAAEGGQPALHPVLPQGRVARSRGLREDRGRLSRRGRDALPRTLRRRPSSCVPGERVSGASGERAPGETGVAGAQQCRRESAEPAPDRRGRAWQEASFRGTARSCSPVPAARCSVRTVSQSIVRLVRGDEDDLLLASGAICATLLLCDLLGVHEGSPSGKPRRAS